MSDCELDYINQCIRSDVSNHYNDIEDIFLEFFDKKMCEAFVGNFNIELKFNIEAMHKNPMSEINGLENMDKFVSRIDWYLDFNKRMKSCLYKLTNNDIEWSIRLDEYHGEAYYKLIIKHTKSILNKYQEYQQLNW